MVETLIIINGQRKVGLRIFDRRIGHFQMDWLTQQFVEDEPTKLYLDQVHFIERTRELCKLTPVRITSGGKLSPFKIELMS